MKRAVIILFAFIAMSITSDSHAESGFLLDGISMDVSGGATVNFWSPKGLGPFKVDTYGRNMAFAELSVNHPLLFVNEALDIIQIPRLRIESNFGYSEQNGSIQELIPSSFRNNPYLKTTSWFTFFEYISIRYRYEKFDATLSDPRYWDPDEFDPNYEYVRTVQNKIKDLEFGLIGQPEGDFEESAIEIGYYLSEISWPLYRYNASSIGDFNLTQEKISIQGFYFSLNTKPIENLWPLHTQFMVKTGNSLGWDLRFKFERQVRKKLSLGFDFDYSWRTITYVDEEEARYYSPSNDKVLDEENPRDTRIRMTAYSRFSIF